MYFQNNMMFNKDNSNNMIQQQQTPTTKLDPEDFIFEKFGKRGWQCENCNNFNFESRIKCNRCGVKMKPKIIKKQKKETIKKEKTTKKSFVEKTGDWICPNCTNINFAFRQSCNRCQLSKQKPLSFHARGGRVEKLHQHTTAAIFPPACDRGFTGKVNPVNMPPAYSPVKP